MILIDGYNLLHVTGIVGRGIGPGTFERARKALVNFLAASLDPDERPSTTVVFDSNDAPPGLPDQLCQQGIAVLFATAYESADELLEELIRQAPTPKRLTVVSSDHRVQRAAKRRKARAVDSDVWYAEIRRSRHTKQSPAVTGPKPTAPLSEDEVAAWLNEFGNVMVEDLSTLELQDSDDPTRGEQVAPTQIENPFPPGYAEDLLDDL